MTVETTRAIIDVTDNDLFAMLIDECRNVSIKKQIIVVVRYVNKKERVIERYLGLVHARDTVSTSLEKDIDPLFSTYGLSVSSFRDQGYDGASNMRIQRIEKFDS